MPVLRVPTFDGAEKLEATIVALETDGHTVGQIVQAGNEYVIVYKPKVKVGRPPKTETRG